MNNGIGYGFWAKCMVKVLIFGIKTVKKLKPPPLFWFCKVYMGL